MSEEAFLGGKVRKQSLPVFAEPPGPGAPVMKRLLLPQGDLAQFWTGKEGMRYIAWVKLKKGGIRGNHLHRKKQEWIYMLEGEIELIVEDPESKVREAVDLVKGDLAVIDTGVGHALRPLHDGEAVEFSPAEFDLTDSEAYPLVD